MDNDINKNNEFSDIKPLNFKTEKDLNTAINDIMMKTNDLKIDWKIREELIKKIGGIMLGNQGQTPFFIKTLNQKLFLNLSIQMLDLRSSLMREACRITILGGRIYKINFESAAEKLITTTSLFKLVGSTNKIISEVGSNCIQELVNNVESIKIIGRIHENIKNKNNIVRLTCSKYFMSILENYNRGIIDKCTNLIEEFLTTCIADSNPEVRSHVRQCYFKYSSLYPNKASVLLQKFDKSIQKIIEEENTNKFGGDDDEIIDYVDFENFDINSNITNTTTDSGKEINKLLSPVHKVKDVKAITEVKKRNSKKEMESPIKTFAKGFESPIKLKTSATKAVITTRYSPSNAKKQPGVPAQSAGKAHHKNILSSHNEKLLDLNIISINDSYQEIENKVSNKSMPFNINSNNSMSTLNTIQNQQMFPTKSKIKSTEDILKNLLTKSQSSDLDTRLIGFVGISNIFPDITHNITMISELTLSNLFSVHINNIFEISNEKIIDQVLKNLNKIVYYIPDHLNEADINKIVKALVIHISLKNELVIHDSKILIELMRKKYDSSFVLKPVVELLNNDISDEIVMVCLEIIFSIIQQTKKQINFLKDQNTFNKIINKLSNLLYEKKQNKEHKDVSTKLLDLFELIFSLYPNQFNYALSFLELDNEKLSINLKQELEINKKEIIKWLNNERINKDDLNKIIEENKISNNIGKCIGNQININMNSLNINNSNNLSNTGNLFCDLNQEVNMEIIKICLSKDIKYCVDYISKDTNCLKQFLIGMTKIKVESSQDLIKCFEILINLIQNKKKVFGDYMEFLLSSLINIITKYDKYNSDKHDNNDISGVKELKDYLDRIFDGIIENPNNDIFLQLAPKFLENQTSTALNFLLSSISKVISKIDPENLLILIPTVIDPLISLLNYQIADTRKLAVFCIVDLYIILGSDFEVFLENLTQNQRNLINIYIKKRKTHKENTK